MAAQRRPIFCSPMPLQTDMVLPGLQAWQSIRAVSDITVSYPFFVTRALTFIFSIVIGETKLVSNSGVDGELM